MEKPYTKITTDTTEFKYFEKDKTGTYKIKNLYLNPYLDMYNSEILSYEISKNPTIEPILKALDKAIKITNKSKEERIKEKLGYLSPIEYRKKNTDRVGGSD